jgi:hypothetical protein
MICDKKMVDPSLLISQWFINWLSAARPANGLNLPDTFGAHDFCNAEYEEDLLIYLDHSNETLGFCYRGYYGAVGIRRASAQARSF